MLTRTTTALLEELADTGNEQVWQSIDARYRPLLAGFAARLGLSEADAADVAQETLVKFVRAYRAGKYHRDRGRLSTWIMSIARNCAIDVQRARVARREKAGASAVVDRASDDELAAHWEAAREREVLRQAMLLLANETRFDPVTVSAFKMLTVHQVSAAEVATETGLSMNEVYLAKHRCLKKLRGIVVELERAYEDDQLGEAS